jgi:hypothetical protein
VVLAVAGLAFVAGPEGPDAAAVVCSASSPSSKLRKTALWSTVRRFCGQSYDYFVTCGQWCDVFCHLWSMVLRFLSLVVNGQFVFSHIYQNKHWIKEPAD